MVKNELVDSQPYLNVRLAGTVRLIGDDLEIKHSENAGFDTIQSDPTTSATRPPMIWTWR